MHLNKTLGTLLALSILATSSSAQIWTEDFDSGGNDGGWVIYWDNFNLLESLGGNPGGYLHLDNLAGTGTCQYVEVFPNAWPANFSGDWRAAGVTSFGFDLNVVVGPIPAASTVVKAKIGFDGGTPNDDTDDCTLEFFHAVPPPTVSGWMPFDFAIDTASTTLPAGWLVEGAGSCIGGSDAIWNQIIQNVSYFEFRVDYDTTIFCNFTNHWDMGVDNLRVEGPTSIFTSFCFGDGTGTICPCGNIGAAGEGCQNSSGSGALLAASGTTSVGTDDITFQLTQGPAGVPGIVFTGTQMENGGAGSLFGDGLLCASGTIQRLGVVFLDGSGAGNWGPGLAPQGGWNPGDTLQIQGWFRDVTGPCNNQFNTTQGIVVDFLP